MKVSDWEPNDLEFIRCDFCGSQNTRDLYRRPDGMQVVECVSCGLAYLNPRPRPELVSRLYDRSYFKKTSDDAKYGYSTDYFDEKNREVMVSAASEKLRLLEPLWQARGKRCLEVGCATGEFSAVLTNHGATSLGLDLSEFVIAQARQTYPAIDFRVGSIEDLSETGSFDAVFAFELIEHVLSPTSFLANAARVLKPGGFLILSTPNLACGGAAGWENWLGFHASYEHLFFFSAETLGTMAQDCGLMLREWFTGGGKGIVAGSGDSSLKRWARTVLDRLGLLASVRRVRREVAPPMTGYVVHGTQHNLLAVLQKNSST